MARPIPVRLRTPPGRLVQCTECARCCTYVASPVSAPDRVKDAATILWFLYHEKVSVYLDSDETWCVVFQARCRHLRSDLRCAIYETRPPICREFDHLSCEVNSRDDGREFFEPREFLQWLRVERPRVYRALAKDYVPEELR
jgi:uncharacterized protein